jgi:hypothetical protein
MLEGGDFQDVTLERAEVDAVSEQLPDVLLAAPQRRGLGAGRRRRRERPRRLEQRLIMPSGVQFNILIFPPGGRRGPSRQATSWWCGANIAPIEDMTTSNDWSSKGRLGVGLDPLIDALGLARRRPASNSLGSGRSR